LIENFSITNGDTLDLRALLSGASLTSNLSNLSSYVSVAGYTSDPFGNGTDTQLSISGPGGKALVSLQGAGQLTVSQLLNANALLLPPH
jgi:hypothetical protein